METPDQQETQQVVPLPFDDFTLSQSVVLVLAMKGSAMLSIIGSSLILLKILNKQNRETKLKTLYHRIMVVTSVNDLLGSLALFMGTWPIPKNNLHNDWIWGNVGNTTTCDIQGYFIQSSVQSVVICTSFLCLYFLLFVRYNWTELKLKKVEICLHVFVFFTYLMSFFPLIDGDFNTSPLFCWIQSYPINCETSDDVSCVRGENSRKFRMYLNFFICIFVGVIVVSMVMLYSAVREQEKLLIRFSSRHSIMVLSQRSRNVFTRAVWFICSAFLIWIPASIMGNESKRGKGSFGLTFLVAITIPLQGFFNFLVYNNFKVKDYTIKLSEFLRRKTMSLFHRRTDSVVEMSENIHDIAETVGGNINCSSAPEALQSQQDEVDEDNTDNLEMELPYGDDSSYRLQILDEITGGPER